MRTWIALFISCCCFMGISQQDPALSAARSELKINVIYTLLTVPELTYERMLGPDVALGISLGFALGGGDISYRVAGPPYYRFYFGNQAAAVFFLN